MFVSVRSRLGGLRPLDWGGEAQEYRMKGGFWKIGRSERIDTVGAESVDDGNRRSSGENKTETAETEA